MEEVLYPLLELSRLAIPISSTINNYNQETLVLPTCSSIVTIYSSFFQKIYITSNHFVMEEVAGCLKIEKLYTLLLSTLYTLLLLPNLVLLLLLSRVVRTTTPTM